MPHISLKEVSRIVLFGIGLSSIAALIFLAGPLVSIGGYHPLETVIGREIAILVVGAIIASVMSFQLAAPEEGRSKTCRRASPPRTNPPMIPASSRTR